MERVTGIGGAFFRARDSKVLVAWYAEHLGGARPGRRLRRVHGEPRRAGVVTVHRGHDFWPAEKQAMVNFVVPDLDAMLAQLRAGGVEVDGNVEMLEGIGRFGWAVDPEGNRCELWEPAGE